MLCDNLEGFEGVGGGREVQERGDIYVYLWLIHVSIQGEKNQHNTVKQLSSN